MKSILFKFLMTATCLVAHPLHGMDKPNPAFEAVATLSTPTMNAVEKTNILSHLGDLRDPPLMPYAAEAAIPLFTENISFKGREKILASIMDQEEPEKIRKVCEAIQTNGPILFTPNMSWREVAKIIYVLTYGCPSEMILEVSHRSCLLITPDMRVWDRIDIIYGVKTLVKRSENNKIWETFEAILSQLPQTSGHVKAGSIKTLMGIAIQNVGELETINANLASMLISKKLPKKC